MKLEGFLKKNWKLLLIAIMVIYLVQSTNFLGLGIESIINPGFEGAKIQFYGVNFKDFGSDWTGTHTIHVAGNAEPSLVSHNDITSWDNIYWGSNGASDATVVHDFSSNVLGLTTATRTQLETRVESNIPLASFNYQTSTPLNISGVADWDKGLLLQYWTVRPIGEYNQTLTNGTILNTVTYNSTSEDMLLIPGNFHLEIKIPSGQTNAGTGSGWQEGSWSSVDFWYVLYWYQWLNSFGNVTSAAEVPPQIPSYAVNNRDLQFQLRGGLPIAGWIAGYQVPIPTASGTTLDAVTYKNKDGLDDQYSSSVISQIGGSVSMSPSLQGSTVDLYTQASDQYKLPAWGTTGNVTAYANLQSPDIQTLIPTEYFKISVNNIGTVAQGLGFANAGGWNVYYPTVNYLMRFIFGVYGTHTYVWDVQTALQQGYNATQNYPPVPTQWHNSTVVGVNVPGWGSTFNLDWFKNPFNQIWVLLIILVILVIFIGPSINAFVLTATGRRKKGE